MYCMAIYMLNGNKHNSLFCRSLCSVVCKWTYEVTKEEVKGWNRDFFSQVGLLDLLDNGCKKIGEPFLQVFKYSSNP